MQKFFSTFPVYQAGSGWNALLSEREPHRVAPAQAEFDAIVIGAGVTGLAAAKRIAELEPASQILLIDASTVGEGASGRNSGFLINVPHNTGMSGHGSPQEVARKQIALYNTGLAWLKGLIDKYKIDCDWNPAGKYHAAATSVGEKSLKRNLEHYSEWGVNFRELGHDELYEELGTHYYKYGYYSDNNVFVQPAALVRGLADNLPGNVYLWEGQPVISLERGSPHAVVTRDKKVFSRRVIIANNGFAKKLGFAKDRTFTIYTYAALTPELDEGELSKLGLQSEWGVIPASRVGTTIRKVGSGRFMVRSADSYEKELPYDRVHALLQGCYQHRYPNMKSHEFEHLWGGVTAATRNGALYFGRIDDGLYISVGCNGAGMLKGSIFGKLLGEMACGCQSPELADALGFQRPSWLPPEPLRRLVVTSAIRYHKIIAGRER